MLEKIETKITERNYQDYQEALLEINNLLRQEDFKKNKLNMFQALMLKAICEAKSHPNKIIIEEWKNIIYLALDYVEFWTHDLLDIFLKPIDEMLLLDDTFSISGDILIDEKLYKKVLDLANNDSLIVFRLKLFLARYKFNKYSAENIKKLKNEIIHSYESIKDISNHPSIAKELQKTIYCFFQGIEIENEYGECTHSPTGTPLKGECEKCMDWFDIYLPQSLRDVLQFIKELNA